MEEEEYEKNQWSVWGFVKRGWEWLRRKTCVYDKNRSTRELPALPLPPKRMTREVEWTICRDIGTFITRFTNDHTLHNDNPIAFRFPSLLLFQRSTYLTCKIFKLSLTLVNECAFGTSPRIIIWFVLIAVFSCIF